MEIKRGGSEASRKGQPTVLRAQSVSYPFSSRRRRPLVSVADSPPLSPAPARPGTPIRSVKPWSVTSGSGPGPARGRPIEESGPAICLVPAGRKHWHGAPQPRP